MKRKSVKNVYQRDIGVNEYPEEIYVARKDSPMILGVEDGESYIASDVLRQIKRSSVNWKGISLLTPKL